MRKIVLMASLALAVFNATAEEVYKFNNLADAVVFARFKSEADEAGRIVEEREKNSRIVAEQYVIDGVKVIVTSKYDKRVRDRLEEASTKISAEKLSYMDECVSLMQNLKLCNELWNERNK